MVWRWWWVNFDIWKFETAHGLIDCDNWLSTREPTNFHWLDNHWPKIEPINTLQFRSPSKKTPHKPTSQRLTIASEWTMAQLPQPLLSIPSASGCKPSCTRCINTTKVHHCVNSVMQPFEVSTTLPQSKLQSHPTLTLLIVHNTKFCSPD